MKDIIIENFPELMKSINPYSGDMMTPKQNKQNNEKRMKKSEDNLRDVWDNIKFSNIHIMGAPGGEEKQKGPEKIFEKDNSRKLP